MNPSSTVHFSGSKPQILRFIKKVVEKYTKKMKVVPHPFEDYSAKNVSVTYGKCTKLKEFLEENHSKIFQEGCLEVARAVCTNLEWPSFNDTITIKSYNHFSNHLSTSFSIHLIVRLHEPFRDSEGHEGIMLKELHRVLRFKIKER